MGSKLIFAYFCSATKVGRRRHNTRQYTVGCRQNENALVSGQKSGPSRPEGQKGLPPQGEAFRRIRSGEQKQMLRRQRHCQAVFRGDLPLGNLHV